MEDIILTKYLKIMEDPRNPDNVYDRTVNNLNNSDYSITVPADIRNIMNQIINWDSISLEEIVEIKTKIEGYKTGTKLDKFIKKLFSNPEINEEQKKEELLSILAIYYKDAYKKRENTDNER